MFVEICCLKNANSGHIFDFFYWFMAHVPPDRGGGGEGERRAPVSPKTDGWIRQCIYFWPVFTALCLVMFQITHTTDIVIG